MKCQTPGRFRWYPARQKNHLLGKNNIQRWQTVCQLKSVPICRVHFLSQWLLNSWCKNGSQSFKRFHTRERSCAISGLRHKELVLDDYAMRPADEYRACDLAQSGLIFQNRTTQKTARMPLAAMTTQEQMVSYGWAGKPCRQRQFFCGSSKVKRDQFSVSPHVSDPTSCASRRGNTISRGP